MPEMEVKYGYTFWKKEKYDESRECGACVYKGNWNGSIYAFLRIALWKYNFEIGRVIVEKKRF